MGTRTTRACAALLVVAMMVTVLPTRPVGAAPTETQLAEVPVDTACDTLVERIVELEACAPEIEVVASATPTPVVTTAATPTPSATAEPTPTADVPAVQPTAESCSADAVLADPNGDWDDDSITNAVELYRGTDACEFDEEAPVAEVEEAEEVDLEPADVASVETAIEVPVVEPEPQPTPTETVIVEEPAPAEVAVVCPGFGVQDVYDDPDGDWDGDNVSNLVEFNQQLDPCVYDETVAREIVDQIVAARTAEEICAGYSVDDVAADRDGDWDRDGVSNVDEFYNSADPCSFDSRTTTSPVAVVTHERCPSFSFDEVLADANGDWDQDGASNVDEFYGNTSPCEFDETVVRSVASSATNSICPAFSVADVNADPAGDWDRDGASNSDEFYGNTNHSRPDWCNSYWWSKTRTCRCWGESPGHHCWRWYRQQQYNYYW